jgi:hypothetical protein
MLTREHLVSLHRSLQGERLLSIYLDRSNDDPATRMAWRLELDRALKELRVRLSASSRAERGDVEQCISLLDRALAENTESRTPGWVAFITPRRVVESHDLHVAVPTLAVWDSGLCLGPYIRALKELRPVIIAVADARKVVLHRYSLGALEHVATLRAQRTVGPHDHMSAPAPTGFHPGTRGRTGRDMAQHALNSGRDRMLTDAAGRITELAGAESWILLGGIARVAAQLAKRLPHSERRVLRATLDVHATAAEIAAAARGAASRLRNDSDAQGLIDIDEAGRTAGMGVLGPDAVRAALELASVSELYFTHQYLLSRPADAEELIRGAVAQNASIEDVTGDPAVFLDARGGVAARLRWRAPQTGAELLEAETAGPIPV